MRRATDAKIDKQVKQVGEGEAGRTGAHDADLSPHDRRITR
jgi:hypothetical protein